jgi:hypothetical protein
MTIVTFFFCVTSCCQGSAAVVAGHLHISAGAHRSLSAGTSPPPRHLVWSRMIRHNNNQDGNLDSLRKSSFSQGYRGEVATKEALAIPPSGSEAQVPNLSSCILDRDSKGSPLVVPHHARQGSHSLGRNVVCDQVAHAHDAIPHTEASARRRGMLRHLVDQCKGAGVWSSSSGSSRWRRACSCWRKSGLRADARGSLGLGLEGLHGDAASFRRRVQSIHALLDFFHDGHVVRLQACHTERVEWGSVGEVCERWGRVAFHSKVGRERWRTRRL